MGGIHYSLLWCGGELDTTAMMMLVMMLDKWYEKVLTPLWSGCLRTLCGQQLCMLSRDSRQKQETRLDATIVQWSQCKTLGCCWRMGWWVAWHSSNTRKRVSVKGERLSERRRRRERLKWTICLFNYNCNYVNCVIIDCAIETCHKATRRGKTRALQKTVCPLQCYLSLSNAYGG